MRVHGNDDIHSGVRAGCARPTSRTTVGWQPVDCQLSCGRLAAHDTRQEDVLYGTLGLMLVKTLEALVRFTHELPGGSSRSAGISSRSIRALSCLAQAGADGLDCVQMGTSESGRRVKIYTDARAQTGSSFTRKKSNGSAPRVSWNGSRRLLRTPHEAPADVVISAKGPRSFSEDGSTLMTRLRAILLKPQTSIFARAFPRGRTRRGAAWFRWRHADQRGVSGGPVVQRVDDLTRDLRHAFRTCALPLSRQRRC